MTKKSFYIVGTAIILFFGCNKDNSKNTNTEACYSNANAHKIMHDGTAREYVMHVPESYTGITPVPLMINFHGYAGNARDYMNYADMRSLAEANSFILVYPQGSCLDGYSHWNACPLGGDNKSDADDFGFVETMINDIASQYSIDLDRVYAAGYSNGGMMAYGLANYRSNLIAAVASVSGAMLDCTGATSHPMPVVHLHGTADNVLPYNGGNGWNSTQRTLEYWINFNQTATSPELSSDNDQGMTIEHYAYDQGNNSVSVEHYKYIGGEHVWFNANFQGQSTSELIWNFVSQYDINGLR